MSTKTCHLFANYNEFFGKIQLKQVTKNHQIKCKQEVFRD